MAYHPQSRWGVGRTAEVRETREPIRDRGSVRTRHRGLHGGLQTCKSGDWLLDNNGDIYTVDRDTFARTYRKLDSGRYVKVTPVWAEPAARAVRVQTKEGITNYQPGDYVVFNDEDGGDAYAVEAEKFRAMYERAD